MLNSMKKSVRLPKKALAVILVLISSFKTSNLWALGSAGLGNQVVGAKALGQGNTFVAQADNASAIFFNPAGLMQLTGSEISIGATFEAPNIDYTDNTGNKTSDNVQTPVVPNFYFSHRLSDQNLSMGVGFHSSYGLSTKWGTDTFSKYVATLSEFNMFTANPTIAFSLSENTHMGIGLDVLDLFNVDLRKQVNVLAVNTALGAPTAGPDASSRLKGGGTGVGFNLGLLFKPNPKHSIGLAYRSEVKVNVEGTQEIHGLSGASASAAAFGGSDYRTIAEGKFRFPEVATVGYSFQPTDRLRWNTDLEWTGWSAFDRLDLSFPQATATQNALLTQDPPRRDWADTYSVGTGFAYKFNGLLTGRLGYLFQQSPIPDARFSTDLPDAARHQATFGTSFEFNAFALDVAYDAVFYRGRAIDNTVGAGSGASIDGKYETFAHVIGINLGYKFGD